MAPADIPIEGQWSGYALRTPSCQVKPATQTLSCPLVIKLLSLCAEQHTDALPAKTHSKSNFSDQAAPCCAKLHTKAHEAENVLRTEHVSLTLLHTKQCYEASYIYLEQCCCVLHFVSKSLDTTAES